jgi:hypothetical protein
VQAGVPEPIHESICVNRKFLPLRVFFKLATPGQRLDRSHPARKYHKGVIWRDLDLTEARSDLAASGKQLWEENMQIDALRNLKAELKTATNQGDYAGKRIHADSVAINEQAEKAAERRAYQDRQLVARYEMQRVKSDGPRPNLKSNVRWGVRTKPRNPVTAFARNVIHNA